MSENPETPDTPDLPPEDVEDFDAFWSSLERTGKRVRIMGTTVTLAASLPLRFELEAKRLQRSREVRDIRHLLTLLGFPDDAMQQWTDKGMDLEQFQVLLAWAPAVIAGKATQADLATYRDLVREHTARAEGKAPAGD